MIPRKSLQLLCSRYSRHCPKSHGHQYPINKYRQQHQQQTSSKRSSSSLSSPSSSSKKCPYKILSIPKKSPYKKAKTSFLKIAMQNHPDTIQHNDQQKIDDSIDTFRHARIAFESLVEDDDGNCMLKIEKEAELEMEMNDQQFDAWFLNETGRNNPYQFDLDPQTMREVAEAAEKMGAGGAERDGGMWGLARMIENTVKDGKDSKNSGSVLRLVAGDVNARTSEDEVEGTLRRRRRGNTRNRNVR